MENKLSNNAKETTRIVLEYLEKFPNSPSKTLATKIYSENEGYFDKFENVYTRVRYYRGQMGNYHRKHLNNKEFQKELKTNVMQNFVSLPRSEQDAVTQGWKKEKDCSQSVDVMLNVKLKYSVECCT